MQQSGRGPQFGRGLNQRPTLLMAHPAVTSHTLKAKGRCWSHLYYHSEYQRCGSLIVATARVTKMTQERTQ